MSKVKPLHVLIKENKTLFVILCVGLFLVELEIFALAALKSGRQSRLQVIDAKGNVIHESDGKHLSDFNKYYFEKNFGPLDQYDVRLQSEEKPFPFRAWFTAAIGLPVGVMLLFGFIIKAWAALFFGASQRSGPEPDGPTTYQTTLEKIVGSVSRLNIFTIGFFMFLAVFLYWVIPNFIQYVGRVGVESIVRYKWFFLTVALVSLAVVLWVIYLRYLLAKKTIETRMEIEKERLLLESGQTCRAPLQLDYQQNPTDAPVGEDRKSEPMGNA